MKMIKWYVTYSLVALVSIASYLVLATELPYYKPSSYIISNFTLNYLLIMIIWGATAPTIVFKKQPFLLRWLLTLIGFVVILAILTLGGLHTRLTNLLGG